MDGLRGLAALVVLLEHTLSPIAMRADVFASRLADALDGQGPVQVFFVLSGFVLAGSLARSAERPPWMQFFVRRVFRIYPPYVVAVLIAWALSPLWVMRPGAEINEAFQRWMTVRASSDDVLRSLAFPGIAAGLLPIGWTLTVEMMFSFAMPLLVAFAGWAGGFPLLVTSLSFLVSPFGLHWYALDFALGVVVYQHRESIARAFGRVPPLVRAAGLVAGAWLLASPPAVVVGVDPHRGAGVRLLPESVAWMGLGAAVLVSGAISVPAFTRLLGSRPCRFLGRISYSFYLLHHSLLKVLAPLMLVPSTRARGVALLAVELAATLAVATVAYHCVERPAIAVGNRLCRWLAQRLGERPVVSHAAEVR